jgi:hypothetical protein
MEKSPHGKIPTWKNPHMEKSPHGKIPTVG